jgi:hypothetical protein
LLGFVTDIKEWCNLLAESADQKFGYSGVGNSFTKSGKDVENEFKIKLDSVKAYEDFISKHMERKKY